MRPPGRSPACTARCGSDPPAFGTPCDVSGRGREPLPVDLDPGPVLIIRQRVRRIKVVYMACVVSSTCAIVGLSAPCTHGGTMYEHQARILREAHDSYVQRLSRTSKAALADEYRGELADHGQYLAYGGPSSKDELISALVELRYPRATMNECQHVLYHQDWISEVCEFCNPDPCPVCGALSTCSYVDGLGAVVNGRHAAEWDFGRAAMTTRTTDA